MVVRDFLECVPIEIEEPDNEFQPWVQAFINEKIKKLEDASSFINSQKTAEQPRTSSSMENQWGEMKEVKVQIEDDNNQYSEIGKTQAETTD